MKAFLFILFIFSVTNYYVNEKIPLDIYIAKIRKELKEISSLHSIEELTYEDFVYELDKVKYTLSSVKSKAVFFNPYMPKAEVVNKVNLTFDFTWKIPEGSKISPYHSIYTADLKSNDKTYQIEFEVESNTFSFSKKWVLYDADSFYVPTGTSEFQFTSLRAKNLDKNSPYTEEIILKIVNEFLNTNHKKRNDAFLETVVGYYKSLPFDEYNQKVYIHTSSFPIEINFDLSLDEMPSYDDATQMCIFNRKGTLNKEQEWIMRYDNQNADTHQTFNLHGTIYQKLISENLFGFDIEQANNPATMYKLIGKDLKKVAIVDDSVTDEEELKIKANMENVTFDAVNPMIGDLSLLVEVLSKEDSSTVFAFTAKFKFTFNPTLIQSGLNFVLLGKNVQLSEIIEEPGYEIKDRNTLLEWIQNTYLCALGQNEYNLFEYALDLSYYFNSNDLSFDFVDEYLSIKKN